VNMRRMICRMVIRVQRKIQPMRFFFLHAAGRVIARGGRSRKNGKEMAMNGYRIPLLTKIAISNDNTDGAPWEFEE